LKIMNQIAVPFAAPLSKGANVGPSTSASSFPSGSGPSVPSQTSGSTTKYSDAIAALANIARGTFLFGSGVGDTIPARCFGKQEVREQ
jgi:hypothetical protein